VHLLGVSLALLSALLFGAGDFSGGFATRHNPPFRVLAWSALSGTLMLGLLAWLLHEPLGQPASALWAALGGLLGAIGVAALYRALSMGHAAVVSPIAGVIGAALPVLVGAFTEGLPATAQMLGFTSAALGIVLVTFSPSHSAAASAPASAPASREQVWLAVFAGLCFGAFFVLIARVEPGAVLVPLLIAKVVAVLLAWGATALTERRLPEIQGYGVAWLSGVLDAAANAVYLLARQHTRLDVAVVLASLYPAFTVLLAYVVLKEHISRVQWMGVALCTAAIALIAV
jgi:drug/metabolite transporter (DMT)-like permease